MPSKRSQQSPTNSQSASGSEHRLATLATLGKHLAVNAVDMATINQTEFKSSIEAIFNLQKDSPTALVRNVLLIGAGASYDAHKDIGTASSIVDKMFKDLKLDSNVKDLILNMLKSFEAFERRNPDTESFEFKMKTLEYLYQDNELRTKLKDELSYKHVVSKFYEITGHMFKHRLIDVIINFNFDEILDSVIEEEMGDSDYTKIYLNGHCPNDNTDLYEKENDKLKTPIYIKPHGTVSHVGSLKYKYSEYNRQNKEIKNLIQYLITDFQKEPNLQVNFICAGYSFRDLDLINILNSAAVKSKWENFSFFIFDNKPLDEYIKQSLVIDKFYKFKKNNVHYIKLTETQPLGNSFKELWDMAAQNFKPGIAEKYLKGIARHEIISKLFYKPTSDMLFKKDSKDPKFVKYISDRIQIEIALVTAQSKGIVHLNQLKTTRIIKYMGQLKLVQETANLWNFLERSQCFDLDYGVMKDTYFVKEELIENGKILINQLIYRLERLIPELKQPIFQHLFELHSKNQLSVINSDPKDYLVSPFKLINPSDLLRNNLRWYIKSAEMLTSKEPWDVVLSISESGFILTDDIYLKQILFRNAVVWSILADHRQVRDKDYDTWSKASDYDTLKCRIEYLPWEGHNKHMILFGKTSQRKGHIEFKHGIYYVRRLLSDVVNPVYLSDKHDLNVMYDYFCSYWFKAQCYRHDGNERLKRLDSAFKKNLLNEFTAQLIIDQKYEEHNLPDWKSSAIES